MKQKFPRLVREEKMFCRECGRVTTHQLFSKTAFNSYDRVDPTLHLVAQCQKCNGQSVVFAGDFRTFVKERPNERGCKIPGRSRIEPGDRIHIDRHPLPAEVEQRLRTFGNQIELTYTHSDGQQGRLRFRQDPVREESSRTYKLLPAQLEHALIGDWVYHVERAVVGKVVGVNRSGRTQIVIRLEGGNYILLRTPLLSGTIEENKTLLLRVKELLQREQLDQLGEIDFSVANGVVYLSGWVPSLWQRHQLVMQAEKIAGVLVVVSRLAVHPTEVVDDATLRDRLQQKLQESALEIRGVRIDVERGKAEVSGELVNKEERDSLYHQLITVAGLRDLKLESRNPPTSFLFSSHFHLFSHLFP